MATILSLYNLAELGIDVDSTDLHVPDGAVRKSQNLITDPKGWARGIKNRDGLQRFNALEAAGSVLGGICVPLPDTRTPPGTNNVELYLGTSPPPGPPPAVPPLFIIPLPDAVI